MKTTLRLKLSIVLFLILVTITTSSAQEKIFQKGENYIWLGHGLINLDFDEYRNWNYDFESSNTIGALFLKYEHALGKNNGIGLTMNYFQSVKSFNNTYELYVTENYYRSMGVLLRYNNHFFVNNVWDIYWGFGTGFKFYSNEVTNTMIDPVIVTTNKYSNHKRNMELSIGAKYNISNGICLYSEFGATRSLFQFGMTFKL